MLGDQLFIGLLLGDGFHVNSAPNHHEALGFLLLFGSLGKECLLGLNC